MTLVMQLSKHDVRSGLARLYRQSIALPRRILLASLIPPRLCGQSDRKWPLCLHDHPLTELFGQALGTEFRYVLSAVAECTQRATDVFASIRDSF